MAIRILLLLLLFSSCMKPVTETNYSLTGWHFIKDNGKITKDSCYVHYFKSLPNSYWDSLCKISPIITVSYNEGVYDSLITNISKY